MPDATIVTRFGSGRAARLQPFAGIAFVVCFIGSVVSSSPPADDASDQQWIANYTGSSNQAHHIATGVFLILAGLSLLVFLTAVWIRIANETESIPNPLPIVAAATAAGCIAAGGAVMGSAFIAVQHSSAPNADILRLGNGLGFTLVGLAGMLATAIAVACLTAQGRTAGIFGRRMTVLGIVAAVALLGAFAFIPIIVLLVWTVATVVVLRPRPE